MDERFRIAHDERAELEAEQVAVPKGEIVSARDAHPAGLGVEPGRERAEGVDPAADPVLGLEDGHIVALALQFEGRHQTGQAGTDDDDPLGRAGSPVEAGIRGGEHLRIDRRGDRGNLIRGGFGHAGGLLL